jgi:thiamine-phosphate pyrophosphorylase
LPPLLPRLYAILDVDVARRLGHDPLTVTDAWLRAGVRLIQLRAKGLESGALLELADRLLLAVHPAGARLIVNDRADIARMADAGGVHVGQEDLSPAAARDIVGPGRWVGLSTHDEVQVRAALREPIDYLAIGPVFETTTKAAAGPVVGLAGVERAAALAGAAGVPVVAIGGITLVEAPRVLAAGAAAVAVITDLLTGHPEDRAGEYLRRLTL